MDKLANKSFLPECWNDDTRMNSLFLEFRSKSVNPQGYEDKMNFWKQLIYETCRRTKKITFNVNDLSKAYERNGRGPQCLQTVVNEMAKDCTITTLAEFEKIGEKKGWMQWGVDVFVVKPISWGLSKSGLTTNNTTGDEKYIHIEYLKELASEFVNKHNDNVSSCWTDNVINMEILFDQSRDICADRETFQSILQYLQSQKQILVINEGTEKLLKFRKGNEELKFTEVDMGIYRLQNVKTKIELEAENLEVQATGCTEQAKDAVKNGLKNKALTILRRRKQCERHLKQKLSTLENVDSLLVKLQESSSEKMVLDAYNSGAKALESTINAYLNTNKVDSTLDAVEEAFDMEAEVESALSRPIISYMEPDTDDLEEELEELLKEDVTPPKVHRPSYTADIIEILGNLPVHQDTPEEVRTTTRKTSAHFEPAS